MIQNLLSIAIDGIKIAFHVIVGVADLYIQFITGIFS